MNRPIVLAALAMLIAATALAQTNVIRPRKKGRTTDAKVMGSRHYTCWRASQLPGLRLRKKYLVMHTRPAVWSEAPTPGNTHGKLRRIFRRLYNRDATNSLRRIRTAIDDSRVRLRPTNDVNAELLDLGEVFDTGGGSNTTTTAISTTTTTTAGQQ